MNKKIIALFLLSVGGVLFSGYLSGVKFFTETCAFNETCPYFLGYPACYFGLGMFLILMITTFFLLFNKVSIAKAVQIILFVSGLGIVFAGYFTFGELPVLFSSGVNTYLLGLPTCALGLIFYIIIFTLGLNTRNTS